MSTLSSRQEASRTPQLNSYLRLVVDVIIEGLSQIAVRPTVHLIPSTSDVGMRFNLSITQGERTPLAEIIDELDALKRRTDGLADDSFRPSKQAFRSARFYIFETYVKMTEAFPRPSFVLDGEKGIVLKWFNNGHSVRLNCMGEFGDEDYIYFENGEYDIEDKVTPQKLQNRLNWLFNQHA